MKQITIKPEGINMHQQHRNIWEQLKTELVELDVKEIKVNCALGAMFQDMSEFIVYPVETTGSCYFIGSINDIKIYVNASMSFNDNRVLSLSEEFEATIDMDSSLMI